MGRRPRTEGETRRSPSADPPRDAARTGPPPATATRSDRDSVGDQHAGKRRLWGKASARKPLGPRDFLPTVPHHVSQISSILGCIFSRSLPPARNPPAPLPPAPFPPHFPGFRAFETLAFQRFKSPNASRHPHMAVVGVGERGGHRPPSGTTPTRHLPDMSGQRRPRAPEPECACA